MVYERTFKVGDKVSRNKSHTIGTVIKITEKRRDVVVDYGRYTERYDKYGLQKNRDVWNRSTIYPLTPELEKELSDRAIILKCKPAIEKLSFDNISVEKAKRILEILKGDEE